MAIKDAEMAWCDGFMPIGDSTLQTLPDVGTSIYNLLDLLTVVYFNFFNVAATPYMLVVNSDGSVYVVETTTLVTTEVAGAGVITSPSLTTLGMTQWGSDFAILVSTQTNGYFICDGSLFYRAGQIAPPTPDTIASGGSGYTSAPTYTVYGGSGSAVTLTPVIEGETIVNLTITDAGSGYSANDVPQVAFSGGGTDTTPIITAVESGGVVTGLNIVNGGTNLTGKPTLTIEGGGGSGATASVTTVTSGVITALTLNEGGSGYTSNPSVVISPGYNNAAYVVLTVMPTGVQGNAVETYQSRVWIADGPSMLFSAPQSYTDFSTAAGGGLFRSADSFLRVNYIRPVQTNGFLYLIADSSINYISNVQTSGDPIVTSFTNQNVNPEVGTPYSQAIDVLGSNIIFANAFGVHVSYGGNASKVSAPLDGVYLSVPNFDGMSLSSAKTIVFGKRVWVLLVPVIDLVTDTQLNKLFMWDEKKWWSTNQSVSLIYIQHQEINSVLTAYGTNGTSIFPLFTTPSTGFVKTVRSKLWAKPGGYMYLKTANRVWLTGQYQTTESPDITFSVDNETTTSTVTLTPSTSGLTTGFYISPPTANGQTGNLLGMTLKTSEATFTLISAAIDAEISGYRG